MSTKSNAMAAMMQANLNTKPTLAAVDPADLTGISLIRLSVDQVEIPQRSPGWPPGREHPARRHEFLGYRQGHPGNARRAGE